MIKYIMIEINGKDVEFSPEEAEKLYHELDKIYGNTGYPLPIEPTKIDPNYWKYYPYIDTTFWKYYPYDTTSNKDLGNIPFTYTY